MLRRSLFGVAAAAAFVSLVVGVGQAATILSASVSSGPATGTVNPVTNAPGNDDYTGSGMANPNQVAITKTVTGLGYVDIVFALQDTPGSKPSEYYVTETVVNDTGVDWLGFHFELGSGSGADFARSGFSDFLDFDYAQPNTDPTQDVDPPTFSPEFSSLVHNANDLWWSGGLVESGDSATFHFSIDVPDNLGGTFTLRQRPSFVTNPEPGTILLFGSGLVGAAASLRKRKKKK